MMTHNPHVALLPRPLPSPGWSMQSSWPNRFSALPVTLHLPLQTRFLVRPQLLTHLSSPHRGGHPSLSSRGVDPSPTSHTEHRGA
jgi:hypothetical protein